MARNAWYAGSLDFIGPNIWGEAADEVDHGSHGKGWLLIDLETQRVERQAIRAAEHDSGHHRQLQPFPVGDGRGAHLGQQDQAREAGQAGLDPCWRMPLDEEYDEGLKSNFADMANVGPRAGGAITAAMFLRRFTGNYRWAHLDIAGTAWKSGAAKGGTGRPVSLLTHYVLSQAG